MTRRIDGLAWSLPDELDGAVADGLAELARKQTLARIWERDHTVWSPDPEEISDRLGWLDVAQHMRDRVADLRDFAQDCVGEGLTSAVLAGMGGSSLAPEVFAASLAEAGRGLALTVCDTTHPDHILAIERSLDLERTLFVIASKSGTTIETRSHMDYFWERLPKGGNFVAITDPGSSLAEVAKERGFRRVYENPPDIGGRYSALSLFGLVPAALMGADLEALLDGAIAMARRTGPEVTVDQNPAGVLGAILGQAALAGRDKLTLVGSRSVSSLGVWIEQLIAESTGKDGRGILPVDGEDLGSPGVYGADRVFSAQGDADLAGLDELGAAGHPFVVAEGDPSDRARLIGGEMFRWELATAIAGAVMGIQPFDQPDVQAAKDATARALEQPQATPEVPSLGEVLSAAGPRRYLSIQAYLPRDPRTAEVLQSVRMRLRDRLRIATTVGFGPRFLHSTGQLHKGGPNTGLFVQVVDDPREDIVVPGRDFTFGRLLRAQADGDLQTLLDRGRVATRVSLAELEAA